MRNIFLPCACTYKPSFSPQCPGNRRLGDREEFRETGDGVVTAGMHLAEFLLLPGRELRLLAHRIGWRQSTAFHAAVAKVDCPGRTHRTNPAPASSCLTVGHEASRMRTSMLPYSRRQRYGPVAQISSITPRSERSRSGSVSLKRNTVASSTFRDDFRSPVMDLA